MVDFTTSSLVKYKPGILTNSINIVMDGSKIILIADLIEDKLQKEKELQYYEAELQRLMFKMSMVRQEIHVTETIIKLIENEEIPNLLKEFNN